MKIACLTGLVVFFIIGMNTVMADDAEAEKNRWLTGKLYGSDNEYAALRKVTLRQENGKYYAFVKNQFTFECELLFGDGGMPAGLRGCRQTTEENKDWSVAEKDIPLKCKVIKKEMVCKGWYNLVSSGLSGMKSEFAIARRLP